MRLLKKVTSDDLMAKDINPENIYDHATLNFFQNKKTSSLKFNIYVINKIFNQLDRRIYFIEDEQFLSIYKNNLSNENELHFGDPRCLGTIKSLIKNLLGNLELERDGNSFFSLGYHIQKNEQDDLIGVFLKIKKYYKNEISYQELVEFKWSRTNYTSTTFMLDVGESSENTLGKIFNDIDNKANIIWIANSFEDKHLEAFKKLRKLNPLSNLKYFKTEFYSLDNDFFLTLSELNGKSLPIVIDQVNNQTFHEKLGEKRIKSILRGKYSEALFNISCNVSLIRFSELIYMCIHEVEWILRNQEILIGNTKRKLNSYELSEIMDYVEKVRSQSIATTARNSIFNLKKREHRVHSKIALSKQFFRNANGEKKLNKIVLASNFWEKYGRDKAISRFHTICNFKDLKFQIENQKKEQKGTELFFKFNGDEVETNLNIDTSVNASVVSIDKVRFENKNMSLTDATNLIVQRFNLIEENKKDVYHPVKCWYCYDSEKSTYVRLDKIYLEKLGFFKNQRDSYLFLGRGRVRSEIINHQFLGEDFWNPKWKLNTLIVGTFNPEDSKDVPYFYGREKGRSGRNMLWRVISEIKFGDRESLRSYNPNFMSTLYEMKLACVDIVQSIWCETTYVDQIITGFSDTKLFNDKVKIIDNMDVISDVISRNPNVNVITTWGKPFTGIEPYIKKFENILNQLKAEGAWKGEYLALSSPSGQRNRQGVSIDKLVVEWKEKLEQKNISI